MAYYEIERFVCRRCCPHLGDPDVFCEKPDQGKRCTRCASVHRPCVPVQGDPYVGRVLEVRRDLRVKDAAGTLQPEDHHRLKSAMKALVKYDRDTQTAKAMATNARKKQIEDSARMFRAAPLLPSSSSSSGKKRKRGSDADAAESVPEPQEPDFKVPNSRFQQLSAEQLTALVLTQAQQCDRAAYAMLKSIGNDPGSIVEFAKFSAEKIAAAGAEMEKGQRSRSSHDTPSTAQSMDAAVIYSSRKEATNRHLDDTEDEEHETEGAVDDEDHAEKDIDSNEEDEAEYDFEEWSDDGDEGGYEKHISRNPQRVTRGASEATSSTDSEGAVKNADRAEEDIDNNNNNNNNNKEDEAEDEDEDEEWPDDEYEGIYENHPISRNRNPQRVTGSVAETISGTDSDSSADEDEDEEKPTPAAKREKPSSPAGYRTPTKQGPAAATFSYFYSDSDGSDGS